MPDYEVYPLWLSHDNGVFENIDPKSLYLNTSLLEMVMIWQNTFDNTYIPEDPKSSGFASQKELHAFEEDGLIIWQKLIDEIGTKYEIEYFSIIRQQLYTNINLVRYNKS